VASSTKLRMQVIQFALNMISPVIGIVSIPILTRFFSSQAYANYATLLTIVTVGSTFIFGRLEVKIPLAMRSNTLDALCAEMRRVAPLSAVLLAISGAILMVFFGDIRQYSLPVLLGCLITFVAMVFVSLETIYTGAEGDFLRLGASRVVQSVILFCSQIGLCQLLSPLLALIIGAGLAHAASFLVLRLRLSTRLIEGGWGRLFEPPAARKTNAPVPLNWGFITQSTLLTLVTQVFTAGLFMIIFVRLYGERSGGVAFLVFRVVAAGVVAASLVAESDIGNLLATVDRPDQLLKMLSNRFALLALLGLVGVAFVYGLTPWAVSLLHREWWSANGYVMPLFLAWWAQLGSNVINIALMNWRRERFVLGSTAVRVLVLAAGLAVSFLLHASAEQTLWIALTLFAVVTAISIAVGFYVLKASVLKGIRAG
jgi:hypothetical protein